MKKMLLAAVAACALSSGANALTLVSAEVRGSGGATVWNTDNSDGFFTLFLQNPGLGDFLNPNSEAVSFDIANTGVSRVLLAGEGFPTNTTFDSDPIYNLLLTFSNGQTLGGQYTPATNTFLGGANTIVEGRTRYTLIEFSYRRFLGDAVQPFVATPGGDGNDYVGNFRISAGVVPEPATWAMMIGGFGLVGAASRRRARANVTFA